MHIPQILLLMLCALSAHTYIHAQPHNPFMLQKVCSSLYVLGQEHARQEAAPKATKAALKIEPSNAQAVLEALQNAREEEQIILAKAIADKITQFDANSIIHMLSATTGKSYETLLASITRNLSCMNPYDVSRILEGDSRAYTHQTMAEALANHYNYLTGFTIAGYQLYAYTESCALYLEAIKKLNPDYQEIALKPVLKNIKYHNLLVLITRTDAALHEPIFKAFESLKNMDLSIYTDHQLLPLLKLTKAHNQIIVAKAIARSIHSYNGWHFYDMFRHCTEASKNIIVGAIVADCQRNPQRYDTFTRDYVAQFCTEKQKLIMLRKAA